MDMQISVIITTAVVVTAANMYWIEPLPARHRSEGCAWIN